MFYFECCSHIYWLSTVIFNLLQNYTAVWTNNLLEQFNVFFPVDLFSLAIALEMIGKFAVTTAYSLVYAFTAEIYPTVLRNTALGACSMASRIGSITAPFFIYLSKDLLSSL